MRTYCVICGLIDYQNTCRAWDCLMVHPQLPDGYRVRYSTILSHYEPYKLSFREIYRRAVFAGALCVIEARQGALFRSFLHGGST